MMPLMSFLLFFCCLSVFETEAQTEGELRLVGPSPSSGRLEIYLREVWGTVCDDSFDLTDARVACRQLGFTEALSAGNAIDLGYSSGNSSSPIYLDEVDCSFDTILLVSCIHRGIGTHDCTHSQDVGVICSESLMRNTEGDLRLVNSFSARGGAGRLEIFLRGEWGTVCDNGFNATEGGVACRQLGYDTVDRVGNVSGLGYPEANSTTPIWLDDVDCSFGAPILLSCLHSGIGNHADCTHDEDVAVQCVFFESALVPSNVNSLIAISVGVTVPLALCLVTPWVVLCVVCRKRRAKKGRKLPPPNQSELSLSAQGEKETHRGEFGVVYKGYLKKSAIAQTFNDTVAVKTVKGFVMEELVEDLLKECGRMLSFDHPNVLKLVGVCLDGGPAPYIIMPFMANGSLNAYLKDNRESLLLDPESAKPADAIAVEKKLLDMCLQIAKGMEYLASKRVIHRDLAARNCMMDINLTIKVADFGLAESLDSSKEYFRQDMDNAIKLPIKWMAPESIHDSVFSEKSDVWSYGVTCWEVFSAGRTPYPGIHPVDLPKQLEKGLRLEKPLNAAFTDEIYTVILTCWESEAKERPCFSDLVSNLVSHLAIRAEYLDFGVAESPVHMAEDSQ